MQPKLAIKFLKELKGAHTTTYSGAIDAAIRALETADPTCGSCKAGILLMDEGPGDEARRVETCDECKLFETDEDAAFAVESLLDVLHGVYKRRYHLAAEEDTSVAGAHDYIEECADGRMEVLVNALQSAQTVLQRLMDHGSEDPIEKRAYEKVQAALKKVGL